MFAIKTIKKLDEFLKKLPKFLGYSLGYLIVLSLWIIGFKLFFILIEFLKF